MNITMQADTMFRRGIPIRAPMALILAGLMASSMAFAEEPEIPRGIRYKRAAPEINERARVAVESVFGRAPHDISPLAKSILHCGSRPWEQIRTDPALEGIKLAPLLMHFPSRDDQACVYEGALAQSDSQVRGVCAAMQKYLGSGGSYVVRKATAEELKAYWAMIAFDIEEPLFVAANSEHLILLDLDEKGKMFWIADLADPGKRSHEGGPVVAAEPGTRISRPGDPARGLDAQQFISGGFEAFQKGNFSRAMVLLNAATRLEPGNATAYFLIGAIGTATRDDDLAIVAFSRVIRLRPDMVAAYFARGNAHFRKQDFKRAIADYTDVIQLKPAEPETYARRSSAHEKLKDRDRAIADWDAAVRLGWLAAKPTR